MDKKTDSPTKTIQFHRCSPAKHLKPLSMYSRMIPSSSHHHQEGFSNPFLNLKIEIINNCFKKRKLDDSSVDDGYETPAKKACSPKDLSPDLGCFVDYCSPPAGQDSPFAIPIPAFLDKTQDIRKEIIQNVSSQLNLKHEESGSLTEPGVDEGIVPHSSESEKILLNLSAFDHDVNNILCLNPVDNVTSSDSASCKLQNNLCPVVSGPVLESHNPPVEYLEGDVEEAWNIGPPIFESSIFQTTLGGEEDTLDTTYESTLPLQVKVKSVVVALHQLASSSNTAAAPPRPKQPAKPRADEVRGSSRRHRPVVFEREADWEYEKQLYVQSVTKHMTEDKGAVQDPMSELLTLMTNVADQTTGADGRQWQHPSDLTRRNYQRRFGNTTPKMTLKEWQSRSDPTHRRFAKMPKIFDRSQFP